jgi:ABC-2 type transport system permease protein
VNLIAIVAFVSWNKIVPSENWLLLVPLLVELYVFTVAVALILATLFVRARDIGQMWELALQVIFYASPIIYPIGYLPEWARKIVFINPLTQIIQDIRAVVLSADVKPNRITVADAFHTSSARLIPIGVTILLLLAAVRLFRREEPYFAERV